ncbi:MAG: efflux RND transporter periplasmic adaptor subunit [Prevotella sp.]|nr:efflux RND transporter periplasmic adaptor subunit [Prevotella sp.]
MITTKMLWLAAAAVTLVACSGKDKQTANENRLDAQEKSRVVETTTVRERPVSDELELNGEVACDEQLLRKVFIPCPGRVSGVSHVVGDYIQAGTVLGVVHSEQAADYHKGLADADAELRMANREYQMQRDMRTSGMASDKDVEAARSRVAMAQAERSRLSTVASIEGIGGRSNAFLRAPISGYITAMNIYNDSYVSEDTNNEPAFEIADLRRVWVIADVYESDISKIHMGDPVVVTTVAYPGRQFIGRVDKINNVLDPDSRTMKVRVSLDNPHGLLKPGMFATAHVMMQRQGERLCCVPTASVIFDNGHNYVVVANGHNYTRRAVRVAHNSSAYTWVSAGLRPDERIVSKNALLLFHHAS